jgi:Tfp pilus assembly protein PilF
MPVNQLATIALLSLICVGAGAQTQKDPTLDEIYRATKQGHIEEATAMIEKVLKDHPQSAKAHFVAAQVYGRTCDRQRARDELKEAEDLQPQLAFASQRSVQELKGLLRQPIPARCGVST